jgi:hypothetical protein
MKVSLFYCYSFFYVRTVDRRFIPKSEDVNTKTFHSWVPKDTTLCNFFWSTKSGLEVLLVFSIKALHIFGLKYTIT